ncbi:UDP-glucose,sterol transferase, putative [Paecilomyces variotii No. 5]|uniref:UDP-glucose,sterol transferase, putative n=1 Tax=Byssochlamys spectabilis (strain No. 5 / NBRC 109023) TaxID=1356009 RepID=V5G416_BYSSN|nr:UDP-glucose,sterol transferase, putative [Paecilomyces variotii No. 5]
METSPAQQPGSSNTMTEEDHEDNFSSRPSMSDGSTTIPESQSGDGVQVTDDGRLDMKFGERKPWISALAKCMGPRAYSNIVDYKPATPTPGEGDQFPLRLNIVIQVVGSRGDIQPFVALGKELRKHGHRIRLATHLTFRSDVKNEGLEFFDIGGDPEQLMAFMVQNPGLFPGVNTIRTGAIQKRRREMKAIFSGCWRSCFEAGEGGALRHDIEGSAPDATDQFVKPFVADVIIANPPVFVHLSCAERMGVPLNIMFTMPWSPTQYFAHPLANIRSQGTKPSVANLASYGIVEVMMWEGLGDLINSFRRNELGLDPLDAIRAPSMNHRLQIPYTYLWYVTHDTFTTRKAHDNRSPSLLPKPEDWPDNIDVCGFQVLPAKSDYNPPEDLAAFLEAGDTPIYIGFGSIVVRDPAKLTKVILDAVSQTGQRALISKGWSNLGSEENELPDNVFFLDACPHDWLFQHVSCVIHHGGAGTTAAGLFLGRPTVIIPFFGDQPFWGSIVEKAGAGPSPVPYKQLTSEKLAAAIMKALELPVRKCAEEIGDKMRHENGTANAVRSFHKHLDVDALRCSICPSRPAVWWHRRLHIKLSAFAFSVLMRTGHIQPGDVNLYRVREYDTNRDPQGPISATAALLYGITTDVIGGLVRVPEQIVDILPASGSKSTANDHRIREWAMQHFADCVAKQQLKNGHQPVAQHEATHDHLEDRNASVNSASQSSTRNHDDNAESDQEDMSISSVDDVDGEISAEQEIQRLTRVHSRARRNLVHTGDKTARLAKHSLKFALVIPRDISLSMSKGFNNLPRLYNDTTVQSTPTVRGIRTGFGAAQKVFLQGFYHGVTGLVTQPAQGFQQSGSKGLVKGVGKGLGGVIFKPAAVISGGSKAYLIISELSCVVSCDVQGEFDLDVGPGLKVEHFYDAFVENGRHKYEFDPQGVGCRYWTCDQIDLLRQLSLITDDAQISTAKDAILKLWPDQIPLLLDKGAYYQ